MNKYYVLAFGPADAEEEALRQVFVECGDVEAVRIVRDSKTGAGKGFGFILFKVTCHQQTSSSSDSGACHHSLFLYPI